MNQESPSKEWAATQQIRQAFIAGATYRPGNIIGGEYRVHRVLGRGGMGLVYLVTKISSNVIFALKTYRDEFIFEEVVQEQIPKESLALLKLRIQPFIL